jgi:hypothetical protein
MSHPIPKIEYKNVEVECDTTNGNAVLTNAADTTNVEAGMNIRGTGIATGATVLSKTSTTVTMSANATASNTDQTIEFYWPIEFDYPPIEENQEEIKPQVRRSTSLSGINQVSVDHIEGIRNLEFSFVTSAIYALFKTFYQTHAVFGRTFRYYEDKTTSSYVEYETESSFKPRKPTGSSTYRFTFNMRRVIDE